MPYCHDLSDRDLCSQATKGIDMTLPTYIGTIKL